MLWGRRTQSFPSSRWVGIVAPGPGCGSRSVGRYRWVLADWPYPYTVESDMPDRPTHGPQSDRVTQAMVLVCEQRGCPPDQAFDLLREKAFLLGQTLEHTALDVLDDIIRFEGRTD